MPYFCHYHKQFLISTFHVGNSDINYYISTTLLPCYLIFSSQLKVSTTWRSIWESCGL